RKRCRPLPDLLREAIASPLPSSGALDEPAGECAIVPGRRGDLGAGPGLDENDAHRARPMIRHRDGPAEGSGGPVDVTQGMVRLLLSAEGGKYTRRQVVVVEEVLVVPVGSEDRGELGQKEEIALDMRLPHVDAPMREPPLPSSGR